jgi:uncharacterized protein (TIGR03000 family)
MNRSTKQVAGWLVLGALFFGLTASAAAQYYGQYSSSYMNTSGNGYYPGYFNSYPGGFTYSPVSLALANYPLTYTSPNGTAIPTYPPSINYPAFYTPNYNFLYNPAMNYRYPTYPPSVNYPAYSNPALYANATPAVPAYNYYGQPATYPTTGNTGYYTTSTYSAAGPTIFPLMSSAPLTNARVSYNASNNWLDSHPLDTRKSNYSPVAVTSHDRSERRVSKSNRSTAYIDLSVPPEAEVWFQGVKTRQKGRVRRFESPPLEAGREFAYDIRVRWTANGQPVTRGHQLRIHRGDWWRVDMNSSGDRFISIPLESTTR